jgi:DNA-binding response OmpR family regulator
MSNNRQTILVVDDERDLLELVSHNLTRAGYNVITASNGTDALRTARAQRPDLLLLDLMIPGVEGTEVTRRLKADPETASIPIVMLTAKGEETDIIVGLTLGADDYITKPFSTKILQARVTAVLRRSEASTSSPTVRVGPLLIDAAKHEASIDQQALRLTLTEFKLLSALVGARGRVLTRDQLMSKAIGPDITVNDRAIDVHITALRKKLGEANYLVHTVRGVGYRLQESPDGAE